LEGDVRDPEHLVVGHLTKAHGTRGELLVRVLTDAPEEVFGPGRRLILGDERGEVGTVPEEGTVEESRSYRKGWLLKLSGVSDRAGAESLAGRYVLVPREERGEPGEGEYYYHQLLGLRVETVTGEDVGRVREVYETEPHHMLEVKGGGGMHLVPFRRQVVRVVDLAEGRLVIDPPEGLLDL
jgi:16S rRNA processing protein RimM